MCNNKYVIYVEKKRRRETTLFRMRHRKNIKKKRTYIHTYEKEMFVKRKGKCERKIKKKRKNVQ